MTTLILIIFLLCLVKCTLFYSEIIKNILGGTIHRGSNYKQISDELGIPVGTLVTWVESHKKEGEQAFPGKGHLKASDAEMAKLRKELGQWRFPK